MKVIMHFSDHSLFERIIKIGNGTVARAIKKKNHLKQYQNILTSNVLTYFYAINSEAYFRFLSKFKNIIFRYL